MNSTYKYRDESLLSVVMREYGTAEALSVVFEANNIVFDNMEALTVELPEFVPEKAVEIPPAPKKELKQTITAESGQVLLDLAIQHYGTAEVFAKLFEQYGELKQPQTGEAFEMPVLEVEDKKALAFFRNKRKVATGTPPVAVGSDQAIITQADFYILSQGGNYIKFR